MNDKNIDFYINLGVEPFKQLSEIGGFHVHPDLELVYPFIDKTKSILELGAGYGRCLDFFLEKNYTGKLIAVEKAKPYLDYLKENYEGRAEILDQDIKSLSISQKVDVILWMFSGIIDFSRDEQMDALKNLSSLLNQQGKIVIDVPRIGFKTYAQHKDNQRLVLESEYGILQCFIPSMEDIIKYQEYAGLSGFIRKDYITPTGKARTIYILQK
jgi:SAM-dependent methyltransferase